MDWLKLAIRKYRSFWGLDGNSRWLLLQGFLLLPLVAVSLKFWGLKRTQAGLSRLLPAKQKKPGFCDNFGNNSEIGEKKSGFLPVSDRSSQILQTKIVKTTRMVRLAARYCQPWAKCLQKSLVLWGLLRRQGINSELRIGVRREGGNFEAHAWVEFEGCAINDARDVRDRFATFERSIEALESLEF